MLVLGWCGLWSHTDLNFYLWVYEEIIWPCLNFLFKKWEFCYPNIFIWSARPTVSTQYIQPVPVGVLPRPVLLTFSRAWKWTQQWKWGPNYLFESGVVHVYLLPCHFRTLYRSTCISRKLDIYQKCLLIITRSTWYNIEKTSRVDVTHFKIQHSSMNAIHQQYLFIVMNFFNFMSHSGLEKIFTRKSLIINSNYLKRI